MATTVLVKSKWDDMQSTEKGAQNKWVLVNQHLLPFIVSSQSWLRSALGDHCHGEWNHGGQVGGPGAHKVEKTTEGPQWPAIGLVFISVMFSRSVIFSRWNGNILKADVFRNVLPNNPKGDLK